MIVITYIDIVMKKEEKATWFSSLMAVGHVLKSSISCKCIPMKGTDNNIYNERMFSFFFLVLIWKQAAASLKALLLWLLHID